MESIPVTVLTGFLGSGKTTLLNRILSEQHGKRIAVIENEFGEVGIDQALVINADEEVFEMNNGCICCTVRGDLIRILNNLMKRKDRFDQILLETTGMADPGPVAQTFFMDEDVQRHFRLDGIVTMVDAKHVSLHLDDSSECQQQIAFADVLVLNKMDLVAPQEAVRLEQRIRSMNAVARLHRATNANVDIAAVLDVGGFDLQRALSTKPTFLDPEYPFEWGGLYSLNEGLATLQLVGGPDSTMQIALIEANDFMTGAERALRSWVRPRTPIAPGAVVPSGECITLDVSRSEAIEFHLRVPRQGQWLLVTEHQAEEYSLLLKGHAHAPSHRYGSHAHDDSVTSVGLHFEGKVDPTRFNVWLRELLQTRGADIFRSKGILNVAGEKNRFVFQGVHMLFDGRADRPWKKGESRENNLVFIGRNLNRAELTEGFRQCLA